MKRMYIAPAIEVHKVELEAMIALSYGIGTADNQDALGRQRLDDWDLWDDEEDDEL